VPGSSVPLHKKKKESRIQEALATIAATLYNSKREVFTTMDIHCIHFFWVSQPVQMREKLKIRDFGGGFPPFLTGDGRLLPSVHNYQFDKVRHTLES
jgi:hypothetical protein